MKYKFQLSECGITLTSLVITIIILMILAGVIIYTFDDSDILNDTKETVNILYNEKKEQSDEIDKMSEDFDKSIVKLSQTEVDLIRNKIKTGNLYSVNYEPQEVSTTVTIAGQYNGELETQTYSQTEIGAKGNNKVNWYVLSADVNQVKLVSSVSDRAVAFRDAGGYDNCLYYLNKLAQDLFLNESLGVTSNRVYALKLTDIKAATEQVNGSEYDWEEDFLKNASVEAYNEGLIGMKIFTPENKRYPQLYGVSATNLYLKNKMYDEDIVKDNNLINGDLINTTSPIATSIKANYTHFSTTSEVNTKELLGSFGNSEIVNELLSTNSWIASRCIAVDSIKADYSLRRINSNYIGSASLCDSRGGVNTLSNSFRVVVSLPASHVTVSNDGTVSIKT